MASHRKHGGASPVVWVGLGVLGLALIGFLASRPGIDVDTRRVEGPVLAALPPSAASPLRVRPASDGQPADAPPPRYEELSAAALATIEQAAAAPPSELAQAPGLATLGVVVIAGPVAGEVRGRGAEATPLEGVRVFIQPADAATESLSETDWSRGSALDVLRTDYLGEVRFQVETGRAWRLHVRVDGVARRVNVDVDPLKVRETRFTTIPVSLEADLGYYATVRGHGGQGVSGARVRLMQGERELAVLRTGPTGSIALTTDAWRQPIMRIDAIGYVPLIVPITPGHETPGTAEILQLRSVGELAVRVISRTSLPVPRATVEARVALDQFVRPDAQRHDLPMRFDSPRSNGEDGWIHFANLPLGVPIDLIARGPSFGSFETTIPPLEAGEARELVLVHPDPVWIAGTALDQNGEVLPGMELWLVRMEHGGPRLLACGDRWAPSATVGADGSFLFKRVFPGRYLIGAARDCDGASGPFVPRSDRKTLNEPPVGGLAGVLVVEPDLPLEGAVVRLEHNLLIRGRVIDEQGRAVIGTRVVARRVDATEGAPPVTRSVKDGAFTIGPVSSGEFELIATTEGYRSRPMNVRAAADGIVVTLRKTGLLNGVAVNGSSGAPVEIDLFVDGRLVGRSARRTGLIVLDVPQEGEFELQARGEAGTGQTRVYVPSFEADVRGVRIEVRPKSVLRLAIQRYAGFEEHQWMESAEWTVVIRQGGATVAVESFRGYYRSFAIDPGTYVVELWAPELHEPWRQEVTIGPRSKRRRVFFDPRDYR